MLTTIEANALAARGHSAGLTRALKRLGMRRCSERLVRYQYEPAAARPSWYCLFWRWFEALWLAHRAGAEFLFEDFCARAAALRDRDEGRREDLAELLAAAEGEHSDVVRAALRGDGLDRLHAEIVEDIAAKRRLLVAVVRLRAEARDAGEQGRPAKAA